MMIRTGLAVAVAATMGLALVSCSDGDDTTAPAGEEEPLRSDGGGNDVPADDPDRQVYIDAFVASLLSDEDLTDDERQCFAVAMVDSVGTEKLRAVVTPEEVSQSDGSAPSELGVEVTQEEGEVFYDLLSGCVDIEQQFTDGVAAGDECLYEALDEDLMRDFYVTLFVLGSQSYMNDSELMARIEAAYAECESTP
jgi:hypothetical protein